MFLANTHPDHGLPMQAADAELLSVQAATEVERFLTYRAGHQPTPLHSLDGLASELAIATLHVKDEGFRLGLGSFKALGGSYAVIRLVLEEAAQQLGRAVDIAELALPEVRAVAEKMTFACATDGNHGRSVAQGAQMVGAKSVVFVHAGVSDERIDAIARFGARMVRCTGTYDDSIAEATRVAAENSWTVVSDTSWPGYERIAGLVMQGYTAMVAEALRQIPAPPTHVFLQAGVGGYAAAAAGCLANLLGARRPKIIVVEPGRAACFFASAQANALVKIDHDQPTVMAMLECCEPSLIAWRILSRLADGYLTLEEKEAIAVMRRLAAPVRCDPPVVAGESGGAGLAGLIQALNATTIAETLGLDGQSRVLVFNTEGATDPAIYKSYVGRAPEEVRP